MITRAPPAVLKLTRKTFNRFRIPRRRGNILPRHTPHPRRDRQPIAHELQLTRRAAFRQRREKLMPPSAFDHPNPAAPFSRTASLSAPPATPPCADDSSAKVTNVQPTFRTTFCVH